MARIKKTRILQWQHKFELHLTVNKAKIFFRQDDKIKEAFYQKAPVSWQNQIF
jgi:hypothetical protein